MNLRMLLALAALTLAGVACASDVTIRCTEVSQCLEGQSCVQGTCRYGDFGPPDAPPVPDASVPDAMIAFDASPFDAAPCPEGCPPGSFCEGNACAPCTTDDHCGTGCEPCVGDTPYCLDGQFCVECLSNTDCPLLAPCCNVSTGVCEFSLGGC